MWKEKAISPIGNVFTLPSHGLDLKEGGRRLVLSNEAQQGEIAKIKCAGRNSKK